MTAPVRAPAPRRSPAPGAPHRGPAPIRAPGALRAAPAPAPDPSRRPTLRLVDGRLDPRRGRRGPLIAAAVVVVLALFGVVVCHALLVPGQVRLDGVEVDVTEQQARYQALRLEVAELEAPGRIVAEAQDRLGMVSPETITYLTAVGPGRAAADAPVATSAQGAGAPWTAVKPLLGGQG